MPGGRPRWVLHIQAQFWRFLMGIGMMLHKLARPRPPKPTFYRDIDATVSPLKGKFRLYFYTPKDYKKQKKLKGTKRYPVVLNFHGGGFVLGTALDDARWCGTVVDKVGAVVVSVAYRLAPELPFPTAVEDGADAILYLAQHADELLLDPDRFAVSGFSSGGNMSFTVPLCLQGELFDRTPSGDRIIDGRAGNVPLAAMRPELTPKAIPPSLGSNLRVPLTRQKSRLDRIALLRQTGSSALSLISSYKESSGVSIMTEGSNAIVKIRGIVSFYPPTDYTQTRAQRRATCARADQQLPAVFTELFDDSYLQPPSLDLAHPWLSPGVAPTHMLEALPDDIVMFTCEWDMLLAEGERFRDKLKNQLGKRVHYHCVPGVPHGWDKAPNPLRESPGARQQYEVACRELKRMFEIEDDDDDSRSSRELSCRQFHKSVDLSQTPAFANGIGLQVDHADGQGGGSASSSRIGSSHGNGNGQANAFGNGLAQTYTHGHGYGHAQSHTSPLAQVQNQRRESEAYTYGHDHDHDHDQATKRW